jgi:hypothetical protein
MAVEETKRFFIKFEDMSVAEAGILAEDLRHVILDAHPDASAAQRRGDPSFQDLGTLLELVLTAPAIIAVAQGMKAWLERYQSVTLRVERPDGTLVAENLTPKRAVEIAKLLQES